jgi:hypothetical protein
VGIRNRLDRAHRATQEGRDMERLKDLFRASMQDHRAQVAGAPHDGATHRIVENGEHGRGEISGPVEDLSEP